MKVSIGAEFEFETVMEYFRNGTVIHYVGKPYYVISIDLKAYRDGTFYGYFELEPANV